MVAGNWLNYDGLYLQYGTQKAVPEVGGDYIVYGSTRELEVLISLGQTVFGSPTGNVSIPALPSSFQGTIASQTTTANTGIVSYTTLFPLQPTAPVSILASSGIYTASVGAANGILNIVNPQMFIDEVSLTTLVPAGAGTGGATGLTGIGLVINLGQIGSTAPAWAQVTPNTGLQLFGAILNAQMVPAATVPGKWTFVPGLPGVSGTAVPIEVLTAYSTSGTAVGTFPGGPQWLGNVPLTGLAETSLPGGLPNNAYISAIASGGTFSGANGGGLLKLRVRYFYYGSINDANQI